MLTGRLGGRHSLAPVLIVLALFGAIIAPAVLLGNSLVNEVQLLFSAYQEGRLAVPAPSAKVAHHTRTAGSCRARATASSQPRMRRARHRTTSRVMGERHGCAPPETCNQP